MLHPFPLQEQIEPAFPGIIGMLSADNLENIDGRAFMLLIPDGEISHPCQIHAVQVFPLGIHKMRTPFKAEEFKSLGGVFHRHLLFLDRFIYCTYVKQMEIEYGQNKRDATMQERGVDFARKSSTALY